MLFYVGNNPPTGRWHGGVPPASIQINSTTVEGPDLSVASASWWLLFVGVRQVILFCCAQAAEIVLVDFLSLSSANFIRFVGPMGVLFLSQGRGVPLRLTIFATFDFLFLYGPGKTAKHWLHW